jgi:hypothetical protein
MKSLKLIGSKFIKIKAEKKLDFNNKFELKTNIKIISLEKLQNSKNSLKLSYGFDVKYGELGEIKLIGIIYLTGNSKIIKELLKIKEKKKYNTPEFITITNLVIKKASIKALELEEELGLPIHIKLPNISISKQ